MRKVIGAVVAVSAFGAFLMTSSPSRAGDESLVSVSCKGGEVSVTASAPWHVNKNAPWKWDKGEKTSLDEHAAKFKGSACEGTIKAYICSGDQCKGPVAVPVK
jgi:hypothetical protein